MNELDLSHLVSTSAGAAVVLGPLIALWGKIKASLREGLVSELECCKIQRDLEDAIEAAIAESEKKQAKFNKDEIERISKWINDNDKELKASNQKIMDHLLDLKS